MYRKVLIPIDDLAFAQQALLAAPRLQPGEVVLLGVMESVGKALATHAGIVAEVSPEVAQNIETAEVAAIKARLRQARQQLVESGCSALVTLEVRHGHPGEQIVQCASDGMCDIVVMSTHARTGVARALLGSVADYVVHNVEAGAVLLLRPPHAAE